MKRSRLMMFTFLTPALLSFLAVYLYPTIRTAIMSLFYVKNVTDRASKWEFVGLENYTHLFGSSLFQTSLKNIAFIWVVAGLIILFFSLLFAIILTSGVRLKSFFRSVIYLPNIVSAVALGTMWIHYAFNAKYGLFHNLFSVLGLKQLAEFQWNAPESVRLTMTIAYSFGMIGYFMLIFMAGIEKIPGDYYEAATIEGASIPKQFAFITLPLLRNVFRTNIVLWSINALGFFVWSQIYSPRNPEIGTVTPIVVMYNTVFGREFVSSDPRLINAGAGSAIGVILTTLTVLVFIIVNALLREDKLEY